MSFFKKLKTMRIRENSSSLPNNVDQNDEHVFDGNVFEINYNNGSDGKESGWMASLHLLTGDLFPMKNFIYSKRNSKTKPNKPNTFYEELIGFIIEMLSMHNGFSFGKVFMLLTCFVGLGGFLYYRWLYLKKREEKMDFVDMALRQKLRFIK